MGSGATHPAAARAAADFDQHEGRDDGRQIADRLTKSLTALRESLLRRLVPPEDSMPVDSMLMPVSEMRAQQHAWEEVEAFMIAESAEAVRGFQFVVDAETWYVQWLTAMRFDVWKPRGDISERVAAYLERPRDDRRLEFSNILVDVIPESRHAPLVLFRLFPTAVHVATALAFGDCETAEKIRAEQAKILPSIAYCQQCHGRLLQDEQECSNCGNPLWNQKWLCEVY